MKYIEEARQVLNDEARALQVLAESLGEEFERTIDCLLSIPGRIAVTGMGKSGHVARKIAATLASTGSPAFFIHPEEASHGDLGMMGTNPDAFAAVDAIGGNDRRPVAADADGFRRAALEAVGAALALILLQTHGVEITLLAHITASHLRSVLLIC